jgi:hypothetical protein
MAGSKLVNLYTAFKKGPSLLVVSSVGYQVFQNAECYQGIKEFYSFR